MAILNLAYSRPGTANPLIPELKKNLHHFGYLSTSNFTDAFDQDLESAIKTYQNYFNVDVTGVLDPATIAQLMKRRCGVPDIFANDGTTMASMSSAKPLSYSYMPSNNKWPANRLTYAFISTSAVPFDHSILSSVFSRAFGRWAAVSSFTFTEVNPDQSPDIKIGFYDKDHQDGKPFDGPLGTLAHASGPTDGRLHVDAAEEWVAEGDVTNASSSYAFDLESVVVHEIGHVLGLGHSSVQAAVMCPTINPRVKKVELAEDDVAGIQSLYA